MPREPERNLFLACSAPPEWRGSISWPLHAELGYLAPLTLHLASQLQRGSQHYLLELGGWHDPSTPPGYKDAQSHWLSKRTVLCWVMVGLWRKALPCEPLCPHRGNGGIHSSFSFRRLGLGLESPHLISEVRKSS